MQQKKGDLEKETRSVEMSRLKLKYIFLNKGEVSR